MSLDFTAINPPPLGPARSPPPPATCPSRAQYVVVGGGVDRYVDRLPPRAPGCDRRRAAGAQAAHLGHHLARGGRGGLGRRDRGRAVDGPLLRRALRAARGGDRAVDGLPPLRLPPARHHRPQRREPAPRDGVHALGGDDQGRAVAARGRRAGAADAHRRRHPRLLDARRGACQPGRRDDVDGQGRSAARRTDLRGHRGHRLPDRPRTGGRRPHPARRHRVREGRDRRGAVGSRAGGQGRRHRAAPGRRALLPPHRADRRRHAGVGAGDRGDRGLRLLPRGGRRPAGRDVRAGRARPGPWTARRATARSPCSRPTGTGWRRSSRSRCGASRHSRTPASAPSSADRRASPTTCRRCSGSRPRSTTSTSPAGSTRSASSPAAVWVT